jgi:Uma2 family endonuclease
MSTLLTSSPDIPTLGNLLEHLGDIPADRVRYYPLPGTATEQDVIDIEARENRICELVDGVLLEKPVGFRESMLAIAIAAALRNFILPRQLGIVTGADGLMKLCSGLVRIPDVAYISTHRLPGGRIPTDPIPLLVPDLVVEVLSTGNSMREMNRKRDEYFAAGVRLAWFVDPGARTIDVYTSAANFVTLRENDSLDGGAVLPGFTLDLRSLFSELD